MLKKIIFSILILYAGISFVYAKVNWISEYNAALKAAKSSDQMLLVQITSETCIYCRKMDNEVLNTEAIENLCSKQVKCAKLDSVLNPDGVQMTRQYKIPGTPATILLDSDGGFIRILNGYIPLERFTKEINNTLARVKEFDKTLLLLKTDPKNIDALALAGNEYFDRRLYEKAIFYANEVIKLDPDNTKSKTDAAYLLKAGISLFQLNDIEAGLKDISLILDKWPSSKSAKPALYLKGLILVNKGETEEGKRHLQNFKEKYPEEQELIRRIDYILARL
jgi:thioredoxin-related protein